MTIHYGPIIYPEYLKGATMKIEQRNMDYHNLTVSVLVVHQRRADGNCMCGRLRPGDSWAAHVANVLHNAGALRDKLPQKDE